ncbi:hypothetical protein Bbelb_003000 [Branchiostoma belcheri]|nr:hypothetical protein Bbelb_003000 [Branchiostoma belcheri]
MSGETCPGLPVRTLALLRTTERKRRLSAATLFTTTDDDRRWRNQHMPYSGNAAPFTESGPLKARRTPQHQSSTTKLKSLDLGRPFYSGEREEKISLRGRIGRVPINSTRGSLCQSNSARRQITIAGTHHRSDATRY